MNPRVIQATLREQSQLTVPREVRDALHVREGDTIGFEFTAAGTVVLRGQQAGIDEPTYLWNDSWQSGMQDALRQLERGEFRRYPSDEAFISHLRTIADESRASDAR